MGQRLSALNAAFAALALAFGSGCAGSKIWGKEGTMAATGVPSAPLSPQVRSDNGVIQASASSQVGGESAWSTSIAKLTGKAERKVPATEVTMLWRNRVDYLPDPAREGQMGAGLAGQLFLYDSRMQPAQAEGKLIVALYDETPRPPGQAANIPEGWEFQKEDLKKLVTIDERFGKCYALFLPWPTFRHDVTRIRVAARFEPENGHPLFAAETRITLDHSAPGASPQAEWTNQLVPAGQPGIFAPGMPAPGSGAGPALISPPGYGSIAPPPPGYGALPPAPLGAMNASGGGVVGPGPVNAPINPASLPPIATILGR